MYRQHRGLHWMGGFALAAVSAALLAGCSHPPPADARSPAATPAQSGARPADAAGPRQPAAASPARPAPLADAERAELIELIRRRAEAESRDRAARPVPAAPAPAPGTTIKSPEQSRGLLSAAGPGTATGDTSAAKPNPSPSVAAQPPQAAQTPAPAGQSPTSAKSGCCGEASGATELVPPPEGSPQPKALCKEPSARLDGVWKGRPAVFHFEIANAGEAPLRIRLKGG